MGTTEIHAQQGPGQSLGLCRLSTFVRQTANISEDMLATLTISVCTGLVFCLKGSFDHLRRMFKFGIPTGCYGVLWSSVNYGFFQEVNMGLVGKKQR